jgi:hypothetical protein
MAIECYFPVSIISWKIDMKTNLAFVAICLVALSGCAIHQTVKPLDRFESRSVCIVENADVRPGFLEAYKGALAERGYKVKTLVPGSSLIECPITSTYTANWHWDLAMYMSFADITVYNNGKPAGKATYDSTHGGGNMSKFIDAKKKITELVNQLYPG